MIYCKSKNPVCVLFIGLIREAETDTLNLNNPKGKIFMPVVKRTKFEMVCFPMTFLFVKKKGGGG